ncbi:MAG: alpha-amylase family glycosyl hydrolase [Tepidiformaceae bacterium]
MAASGAPQGTDWWREAVVYQVYPRSFQDTNSDGIGDLQGIIDRLDYLNDGSERSLGIDGIWLSPTFPSPMKDFGYDVSDYCGVHPDFGDMETMDRLISECHRRGIRLLLDFVPNHSSEMHPWFLESRSSRTSPKRDWYIWRDARPDGGLPNNWQAIFGGPAWEWDEATGQYYLHSFLVEQPDLNWRNPEVVAAMHDVLRFWIDRGIDGFRIDVMGMVVKHPELLDNPLNPAWQTGDPWRWQYLWANNQNYPDVFDAVRGIRAVLDEYPGRMAVGEVFGSAAEIAAYYGGEKLDGLQLAFDFHFIHERYPLYTPWEAPRLHGIAHRAETALPEGAQPCWAFNNHDRPRFPSRQNAAGHGQERARAAPLVLLALRGTPFLYYGEEIGMEDVRIPGDRLQDPARFHEAGRDPERTPMQWDATGGRGFSAAEPWLPFGPRQINVAAQDTAPDSLLSLYRRAIWRRKQEPSLLRGRCTLLPDDDYVFAFLREADGARTVLVAVNTDAVDRRLPLPPGEWVVLVASSLAMEQTPASSRLVLPPFAAAWLVPAGPAAGGAASVILDA